MKKVLWFVVLSLLLSTNGKAKMTGPVEFFGGDEEFVIYKSPLYTEYVYSGDSSDLRDNLTTHCKKFNKHTFLMGVRVKSGKWNRDFKVSAGGMGSKWYRRFICAKSNDEANEIFKRIYKIKNYKDIKYKTKRYIIKYVNENPNEDYVLTSDIYGTFEQKIKNAQLIEVEKDKIKKQKEAEKNKPKTVAKKPEKKEPKKVVKKPETKTTKSSDIDSSLITIGSGSAFYINGQGYALSNNHVVNICKQSVARVDGREILFRVVATDKTNDVAILKTDKRTRNYIKINEDGAKLGENIVAVGYPLAGRLSDSVKITRGIVSSLSGINNNIGQIQIDAALQPGNSGGPVLNEKGEMIGIASAGLNKLLMAKEAKYIPENVNFAVAAPIVVNILKNKKIKYSSSGIFGGKYSNTELAELGNSATIQLLCRNTRTAYNRLKGDKKYTHVLLDLE